MSREAQIPLFLWVAAAVVAHLLWGGGADKAARVIEEKIEIREFAASVRRFVRGEGRPIEVALLDEENLPKEADPDAPEQPRADEPVDPDQKSAEKDEAPPDKRKVPPPEVKKEEEAEKRPPEEKKPEEEKKKEAEEKKTDAEKAAELPAAPVDKKVAVKQHVADPDQKDNPDAKFIAEQANRVAEESQAKITATDQDDPKPTPGGAAQSSNDPNDPGDADQTHIRQSDDHAGAQDRAPSEHPPPTELRLAEQAPRAASAAAAAQAKLDGVKNGAQRSNSASKLPAEAGQAAQPALSAADAVPETLDSSRGGYVVAREKEASLEQQGRQARKRRELPPLRSTGIQGLLGLGATGTTPGGLNLNLSPQIAVAAIGHDTLARERVADGERRRSEHAGHWRPAGIERWRASIENYVPSVRPGNQTALNTAASPFASYLNQVHSRIHPIFADGFLASLDSLPASNPMNRPEIYTALEIVLDRDQGRIQRMGVTRTSGVTAFDVSALESVYRAQPFGAPPQTIVSPDGNVYFHWEFHRGVEACGTANAHPFMLKVQPKSAPPPLVPTAPPEEGQERHGSLPRRRSPLGEAPRPLALVP
jgi:hypothetical protein